VFILIANKNQNDPIFVLLRSVKHLKGALSFEIYSEFLRCSCLFSEMTKYFL
jgi:hypothetical protein